MVRPVLNSYSKRREQIELALLFFSFILFFIAVPIELLFINYAYNMGLICIFLYYALWRDRFLMFKIEKSILPYVSAIFIIITIGWLFNLHHYTLVLYLKIIALFAFFSKSSIRLQSFIKYVNYTYLIYALFSYLMSYGIIPSFITKTQLNQQYEVLFGFPIWTLIGIEGSTAAIDSYSGLVALLNLFLSKSKTRYFWAFFAIFSVVLTTRMTPLVAFFGAFMSFFFVRNKKIAILACLLTMTGFFTLLILQHYYPDMTVSIYGNNIELSIIFVASTHARSLIWEKQLMNVYEYYSIFDYIFGYFDDKITHVTVLWGRHKEMINPHNSYIYLFFLSPFLAIGTYILILRKTYTQYSRHLFPIIFFILVAGFTTQKIFVVENPIYLYVLIFLLMGRYKKIAPSYG